MCRRHATIMFKTIWRVIFLWATSSYINNVAGIFHQIFPQSQLPLYEEFLGRSAKLESQLKATGVTFSAFLDTAQKIADAASKSKGSEKLSILSNSIWTYFLFIAVTSDQRDVNPKEILFQDPTFSLSLFNFSLSLFFRFQQWPRSVSDPGGDEAESHGGNQPSS